MNKNDFLESEKDSFSNDLTEKLEIMNFNISEQPLFLRNALCLEKNETLDDLSKIDPRYKNKESELNLLSLEKKEIHGIAARKDKRYPNLLRSIESFMKIVRIFAIVHTFIQKLRRKITKIRFLNSNFPFEMLNDACYFNAELMENKGKFWKNLTARMKFKKIPNYLQNLFQLLFIVICIFTVLCVPLTIAVGSKFERSWLFCMAFLLNLFSNHFYMYCEKAVLFEKNNKKNSLSYLWDFFSDLSPCIYFFLKIFLEQEIVGILFLPSFIILKTKIEKAKYYFLRRKTQKTLLSFISLIFCIFLVIHYFACISIYFGRNEKANNTGWFIQHDLSPENDIIKIYLISLYNMIFRDEFPSTLIEKTLHISFVAIGFVLVLWNLNQIKKILKDLNNKDNRLTNQMDVINNYLSENNFNYPLKLKIDKFIKNSYEEKMNLDHEIQQIYKNIPLQLRLELFRAKNGELTEKISFLSLFSPEFMIKFFDHMEIKIFSPNDLIYEKNQADPSFYLVEKGTMEMCLDIPGKDNLIIGRVKEGETFGDSLHFSNENLKFSIRSQKFTTLKFIKRSKFFDIVKENRSDYEKFCFLRDQINLNKHFSNLIDSCKNCNNPSHNAFDCVCNFLFSRKQQIIRDHVSSRPQKRNLFHRKKIIKGPNALFQKKKIYEKLFESGATLISESEEHPLSVKIKSLDMLVPSIDTEKKLEDCEEDFSKTSLEGMLMKKKLTEENSSISKKNSAMLIERKKNQESENCNKENLEEKSLLYFDSKFESSKLSLLLGDNSINMDMIGEFQYYFTQNNISKIIMENRNRKKNSENEETSKILNKNKKLRNMRIGIWKRIKIFLKCLFFKKRK